MAHSALLGKVCLVTGATRGIGKGVAVQLGVAGATVYITGRTLKSEISTAGSLTETAKEIESLGGYCIPVQCDHSKDDDIKNLFERIKRDQNGQLDVLVNNAFSATNTIYDNLGKTFWESKPGLWDKINDVGLRNHYICSVYASRLMVPRKSGLIVNISSMGGLKYMFNVPYGVGKVGMDRMAQDCSLELKKHNVAFVSLWPGPARTENVADFVKSGRAKNTVLADVFDSGESQEFTGKCITFLAIDPDIMRKSGRVLMTADLALNNGFDDVDGTWIESPRQLKNILKLYNQEWLAEYIPGFIKVPYRILSLFGSKF